MLISAYVAALRRPTPPDEAETLGPEKWPDPTFSSAAGITSMGANWAVSGGVATSNGSSGNIRKASVLEIGVEYKAVITINSRTAGEIYFGWDGVSTDYNRAHLPGTYTAYFTAQGTDLYLWSAAFNGSVDDYSVKEVTAGAPPPPPPPPAPSPITATTGADYATFLNQFYPSRPYQQNHAIWTQSVGGGKAVWDVLTNDQVGTPGGSILKRSARFRAKYSGYVPTMRIYWIAATTGTYSRGNGGIIRMRIYPDNGSGLPNESGTIYGECTFTPACNHSLPIEQIITAGNGTHFQNHTFSQLSPLVAGTRYHVVFENIHSDPVNNYISLESANTRVDNIPTDAPFDRLEWVTLRKTGSAAWSTSFTGSVNYLLQPIMQINQESGSYGFGQFGPGNYQRDTGSDYVFTFTNAAPTRTRIRPATTRTWYGGAIALNTTTGGYIDWTLKTEGGTTLASGSFQQSTANDAATAQDSLTTKFATWFPFWFGTGVTLTANTNYYLTYTPRSSSSWKTTVAGDGRASSRFPVLAWPELWAQHYQSGSFIGSAGNTKTTNVDYGNWREYFITSS